MKCLTHILFICFSYSYLIDLPFPSVDGEHARKRNHNHHSLGKHERKVKNHFTAKPFTKQEEKTHKARRQVNNAQGPGTLNVVKNDSSSEAYSSEIEREEPQKEFNEGRWLHKQFEALNNTLPKGDTVNMLAVRPWGVPCGDPNMQDMATGTCTLPSECDPVLRIFRGDHFCKQTKFVCCAILEAEYDLNQPFDASFAGTSFEPDSDEARERIRNQNEGHVNKDFNKRQNERHKRKVAMKNLIDRIVREVKVIMKKAQQNGTIQKMKKTKQLKMFLIDLKNQYKKERQAVGDIQEVYQVQIDGTLRKKLHEIKEVYSRFMNNETFRNIVLSGAKSMSKREADMLVEAYPELEAYIAKRRDNRDIDKMSYDIEYGLMFY